VRKGRKHQAIYVCFFEYYHQTEALIWFACFDAGGLNRFDAAIHPVPDLLDRVRMLIVLYHAITFVETPKEGATGTGTRR
jgi:hypothetical protein